MPMLTVKSIAEATSQKGGTYWKVVGEDDAAYFVWDSKLAKVLRPGATYEVEVKDGRFPKLTAAREVATPDGTAQPVQDEGQPEAEGETERAIRIELVIAIDPQTLGGLIDLLSVLLERPNRK